MAVASPFNRTTSGMSTTLSNGQVLFAFGQGPGKADLYDPKTNLVSQTATSGGGNVASFGWNTLSSGTLLFVGGRAGNTDLWQTYTYSPSKGFAKGPNLPTAMRGQSVQHLPNGNAIFFGGVTGSGGSLMTSYIYDASKGTI